MSQNRAVNSNGLMNLEGILKPLVDDGTIVIEKFDDKKHDAKKFEDCDCDPGGRGRICRRHLLSAFAKELQNQPRPSRKVEDRARKNKPLSEVEFQMLLQEERDLTPLSLRLISTLIEKMEEVKNEK